METVTLDFHMMMIKIDNYFGRPPMSINFSVLHNTRYRLIYLQLTK